MTTQLSERVWQLLNTTDNMQPMCVHHVATSLGMSERTLQRRLHLEKITWSEVLDRARRARALLRVGQGMPSEGLARELGYSQQRAFFRAFRRWTGRSPSEWKESTQQEATLLESNLYGAHAPSAA